MALKYFLKTSLDKYSVFCLFSLDIVNVKVVLEQDHSEGDIFSHFSYMTFLANLCLLLRHNIVFPPLAVSAAAEKELKAILTPSSSFLLSCEGDCLKYGILHYSKEGALTMAFATTVATSG